MFTIDDIKLCEFNKSNNYHRNFFPINSSHVQFYNYFQVAAKSATMRINWIWWSDGECKRGRSLRVRLIRPRELDFVDSRKTAMRHSVNNRGACVGGCRKRATPLWIRLHALHCTIYVQWLCVHVSFSKNNWLDNLSICCISNRQWPISVL